MSRLTVSASSGSAAVSTDVLVSTTRIAAELMGVDRDLGTIEVGKRADLVAVSGDAFDFADLRERIAFVYQDGRLVSGRAEREVAVPA